MGRSKTYQRLRRLNRSIAGIRNIACDGIGVLDGDHLDCKAEARAKFLLILNAADDVMRLREATDG